MANPIIDVYVHFGAPGDPAKGDPCYWSEAFEPLKISSSDSREQAHRVSLILGPKFFLRSF